MKLYGNFTSPFVRHCRIVLQESGTDFELVEADASMTSELSPMKKMPFLTWEDSGSEQQLSDSTAIVKFIRERAGKIFIPDVMDFNAFCAANTLLDSAINLFYLEKDGVVSAGSAYLQRQEYRLRTGLAWLEGLDYTRGQGDTPWSDTQLRIACFLDWALFRQRFSLEDFPKLQAFLDDIRQYPPFAATAPAVT